MWNVTEIKFIKFTFAYWDVFRYGDRAAERVEITNKSMEIFSWVLVAEESSRLEKSESLIDSSLTHWSEAANILLAIYLFPFFLLGFSFFCFSYKAVSFFCVFSFYGLLIAAKLPLRHYSVSKEERGLSTIQAFKESHYLFAEHKEDIKVFSLFYQFDPSGERCFVAIKIKQWSHHRGRNQGAYVARA